jgi:peptide/nickel transport system substrate-binding protein
VGTVVPVDSLDPADSVMFGDLEVLHTINEGLLRREPGDGEIVPGIAEDLPEISEDGLTYTFRLRSGVEFSDGLQLTAPLYVESIERVLQLRGRSANLVSLYVANVEAPDDRTVVFRLKDRFAFFPTLLAESAYGPVHPDVFPAEELAVFPDAPVHGVGPWFITSHSESEIVFELNPRYFGDAPSVDRIVLRIYENADDMASAIGNADIDLAWRGLDAQAAAEISEVEEVNVELVPGGTMQFLTVNHSLGPTDDPLVRRALAQLIERETISSEELGGAFVPAYSPVPPGYVGSSDSFSEVFGEPNVATAIDLLTEAGYSDSNRAQIELAYPPERFGLVIPTAMEEVELQMESTGLVDVTLTAQPWSTYVGDVVAGSYNLAFLGWLHDFPDTHNYMAPFILEGGVGGSGENLEHPEMVDLITEAASTLDEEQRAELYVEIQTLFAEDVVTIPLWTEHPYIAYRDSVHGDERLANPSSLNVGASMMLDFRSIVIDPAES